MAEKRFTSNAVIMDTTVQFQRIKNGGGKRELGYGRREAGSWARVCARAIAVQRVFHSGTARGG